MTQPIWSAPVRFAEADQQGIVFNAHYLVYCDEAMGAFCASRGLSSFAERVRLKSSTLTWDSPVRHGDTVDVYASCSRIGTTSMTMSFEVKVADRTCCVVDTTYVSIDDSGAPQPIPAETAQSLR
ncbi:thioesterase family protein [Williamsia sp.]|uniref:acyl-CoA thioesterase n=1 Tax=Williamsia sp. TaxID=1872085 RepID=UPI002F93B3CC